MLFCSHSFSIEKLEEVPLRQTSQYSVKWDSKCYNSLQHEVSGDLKETVGNLCLYSYFLVQKQFCYVNYTSIEYTGRKYG